MSRISEAWARAWRNTVRRLREEDAKRDALEAPTVEVEMVDVEPQPSFTCPVCGQTSHHPKDIEEGYCGNCHWWTGRKDMLADRLESWIWSAERGEMPDGCPLHPAVLDSLVLVLQRR